MNLNHLKDSDLLSQTKLLVQKERQLLTEVLRHLTEVERRRLFSDLGYQSLFEYAVKELRYSEGQVGRRIQAMRLIKEIPEVEEKIKGGNLSLSNICQAQSYFRESKKFSHGKGQQDCEKLSKDLNPCEKLKVLKSLENLSAREGQKVLLKMQPQMSLPKERQRALTEAHTEVRFVMSEDLKAQLELVRSLLGPKGATMGFADLINYMAAAAIQNLKVKKFGKKRVETDTSVSIMDNPAVAPTSELHQVATNSTAPTSELSQITKNSNIPSSELHHITESLTTPTLELQTVKGVSNDQKNARYISKQTRHLIWKRDQGRCRKCASQNNLNIDHVKPVALGGTSSPENLRLLCFNCNQRQALKAFGLDHIHSKQLRSMPPRIKKEKETA